MMKFGLFEKLNISDKPLMIFEAKNEKKAWEKLKTGGIYNRTKIFELIKI